MPVDGDEMKFFIVVLIVLNALAFYLYQQGVIGVAEEGETVVASVDQPLLQLASERVGPELPVSEPPVEFVPYCYAVAELDEPLFDQLVLRMNEMEIPIQSEPQKRGEIENYWVYVPAQETLRETRALYEEMVGMGVKDLYVIEVGKNRNTISLGLYSQHASALERLEWFSARDIEVLIEPRYKSWDIYRVDIGPLSEQKNEIMLEIMSGEFSSLEYENSSCI